MTNVTANAFDELKWRGLVYDFTEGVPDVLTQEKITAYIGFDPTSDSLQVGNLVALMGLARLQTGYGCPPLMRASSPTLTT